MKTAKKPRNTKPKLFGIEIKWPHIAEWHPWRAFETASGRDLELRRLVRNEPEWLKKMGFQKYYVKVDLSP